MKMYPTQTENILEKAHIKLTSVMHQWYADRVDAGLDVSHPYDFMSKLAAHVVCVLPGMGIITQTPALDHIPVAKQSTKTPITEKEALTPFTEAERYDNIALNMSLNIAKAMDAEKLKIRETVLIPFCRKWNVGFIYNMGICCFVMPDGFEFGRGDLMWHPEAYDELPDRKHGAEWTKERIAAFTNMFDFLHRTCFGQCIGWDIENVI